MFEEEFSLGSSIFHRADPRIKSILGFLIILGIVLTNNITICSGFFISSCVFVIIANLSIFKVIKRLVIVNSFVLFLWFFLPFSTPGRELVNIYGLEVTYEGLIQTILITLKANSAVLVVMSFINTTPIPILGHGLSKLKLPAKFVLLFLLSYRYIGVIFEEFTRMMNAARVRNFNPRTNLHTYKTFSYMLAMVLIKSYERGKRVYNAMMLRGFNGKFYSLQELKLSKYDLMVAYLSFFLVVMSVFSYYITDLIASLS